MRFFQTISPCYSSSKIISVQIFRTEFLKYYYAEIHFFKGCRNNICKTYKCIHFSHAGCSPALIGFFDSHFIAFYLFSFGYSGLLTTGEPPELLVFALDLGSI